MSEPKAAESFSSGSAAAVLLCSQQTVIRAVDRGVIRGYRLPNGFRRINRADLVAYCRANGLAHALEALGEKPE